jgi:hypothetical protein
MNTQFPISLTFTLNDDDNFIPFTFRCEESTVDQEVIEEMMPLLNEFFNNLSSTDNISGNLSVIIDEEVEEKIRLFKNDKQIKHILGPYLKCEDSDNFDECSICLCKYLKNEYKRILKCDHKYHKKCIDKWLKQGSSACPLCKQDQFVEK